MNSKHRTAEGDTNTTTPQQRTIGTSSPGETDPCLTQARTSLASSLAESAKRNSRMNTGVTVDDAVTKAFNDLKLKVGCRISLSLRSESPEVIR